jgi:hypothetical protein
MHFGTGVVDLDQKSSSYYVRAVCNGPSTGHLVDNGDNTVTDTATGLMWQQLEVVDELNAVSPMTWEEALSYCETLELAGYDDWRLPNINELQSITDYEKAVSANDPAIDTGFFPNAVPDIYWSATTYIDHTEGAWTVSFGSGIVSIYTKSIGHYVRVVRGGQ